MPLSLKPPVALHLLTVILCSTFVRVVNLLKLIGAINYIVNLRTTFLRELLNNAGT